MRAFTASAVREGRWWVVTVPDVGTTQGRATAEAQRMAVDMVAPMLGMPETEVEVDVDFQVPSDLAAEVEAARAATVQAAEAQQSAAQLSRAVVAHLLDAGLSKRDTARVLKVAPQRISQLTRTGMSSALPR